MHVDFINQQLEERSGDSLSLQNQMTVTHSAVFDTITQTTFETVICELPYEKLLEAFENLIRPLLRRIKKNIKESDVLMVVRDTHLTKLLSSEQLTGSVPKEVVQ
ncbi:hypothetical protein ACF3VQ_18275 [Yersinia sp. HM-2024]|uniref:hypothetical protein n=1 Tax=Yersinia sp. HM-2024 TaxID=3344550 RepID=UPI00370DC4BE